MDDDTADIIASLCARAGMIMEDQSVAALTIGTDRGAVATTLVSLSHEVWRIDALITAARAMLPTA